MELMGSIFFYFVIAQTALDERGIAGSFFPPLAIGLSLIVVHLALIPFTGCGVNPARTFGPSMVICMSTSGNCSEVVSSSYWIYWIGPFVAASIVAEFTLWLKKIDREISDEGAVEQQQEVPVKEQAAQDVEE